jgi:hypothetical protein
MANQHLVLGAMAPSSFQLQAATEVDAASTLLPRLDSFLAQLQAVPVAVLASFS